MILWSQGNPVINLDYLPTGELMAVSAASHDLFSGHSGQHRCALRRLERSFRCRSHEMRHLFRLRPLLAALRQWPDKHCATGLQRPQRPRLVQPGSVGHHTRIQSQGRIGKKARINR